MRFGLQPGPGQGHRVRVVALPGRRRPDLAELVTDVGQQRSVPRAADGDGPRRVLPRHLDLLGPHLQGLIGLAHPYGVAAHLLQVEVLDVDVAGGQTPGHRGVAADDHAGHTGEAVAGHLERARLGHRPAVQTQLGEGRRDRGGQVGVVGQDRLAGGGPVSRHDPGVGPGGAVDRTVRDQGRHRLQPARDRPQHVGVRGGVRGGQPAGQRPAGAGVSLGVEDARADGARGDDGVEAALQRVVRPQVRGLVRADPGEHQRRLDLTIHVGARGPRPSPSTRPASPPPSTARACSRVPAARAGCTPARCRPGGATAGRR